MNEADAQRSATDIVRDAMSEMKGGGYENAY
jgi:hypothetical protein